MQLFSLVFCIRRWWLCLFLAGSLQCAAGDLVQEKERAFFTIKERSPQSLFVHTDGTLSCHVLQLLQVTNLYNSSDDLAKVVEKTQRAWLSCVQGRGGIERGDFQDSDLRKRLKPVVDSIATQMGLFEERAPLQNHYDYAFCYGDFLDGVRGRITQMVKAWKSGIRFKTILCLTGERYLRKGEGEAESMKILCDPTKSLLPFKEGWSLPKEAPYETEYDMMRLVFDQIQLPADMVENTKIVFVNASKGDKPRPSTKDTITTWICALSEAEKRMVGTAIAFSHPLVWVHQQIVAEVALQNTDIAVDTVAPALTKNIRDRYENSFVSLVLDTVAKCLYELYISKERRNVSIVSE